MPSIAPSSVFLLLTFVEIALGQLKSIFATVDNVVDKSCPSWMTLFTVEGSSKIDCSVLCSDNAGCESALFYRDTRDCFGCSGGLAALVNSPQIPNRAVAVIQLPPILRVAGMKLTIHLDTPLSYSSAAATCAPYGALVRPDTSYKMQELRAVLSDIYRPFWLHTFWMQCRYDVTRALWKFDDGTPIADYWCTDPEAPNDVQNGARCCWLWKGCGFALDDYDCSDPNPFICEID